MIKYEICLKQWHCTFTVPPPKNYLIKFFDIIKVSFYKTFEYFLTIFSLCLCFQYLSWTFFFFFSKKNIFISYLFIQIFFLHPQTQLGEDFHYFFLVMALLQSSGYIFWTGRNTAKKHLCFVKVLSITLWQPCNPTFKKHLAWNITTKSNIFFTWGRIWTEG